VPRSSYGVRRSRLRILTAALLTSTVTGVARPTVGGCQATVTGTVFDSTSRVMLAGAVVQLVPAADPSAPIAHTARTDSTGRFTITGVRPGRYLAAFLHPVLDSLGIEPAPRSFDVAAGAGTVRLPLAVPSAATIARVLCGPTGRSDSTSTVFGRLYDAETLQPVRGGSVSVRWNEITIGAGGARQRRPEVRGSTADDGGFAFCNVPGDALVGLRGARGGDTTGTVELQLRAGGAVRRDLFVGSVISTTLVDTVTLGDSGKGSLSRVIRRGRAELTGTVRDKERRPIKGARLRVAEGGVETVTNAEGVFLLSGAPGGTQTLEVRAIGYYPEERPVDLVAGRLATLQITLATLRSVLDTVRIIASRVYSSDRNGFERRRRSAASGRFFDQSDVERFRPIGVTQLLNRVPGVTIASASFDNPVLMRDLYSGGYCLPAVYIDGLRMTELSAREIDMWVRPEELEGMEVYPRAGQAPAEFTRLDGCGSIVLWTQRRLPKRPRR
jgi:carboxypeptidase family protein